MRGHPGKNIAQKSRNSCKLRHGKFLLAALLAVEVDVAKRLGHHVKSLGGVDQLGGIEADVKHLRLPVPFFDVFLDEQDRWDKVLFTAGLGLVAKVVLHDDALGPHHALGGLKMGVDVVNVPNANVTDVQPSGPLDKNMSVFIWSDVVHGVVLLLFVTELVHK